MHLVRYGLVLQFVVPEVTHLGAGFQQVLEGALGFETTVLEDEDLVGAL